MDSIIEAWQEHGDKRPVIECDIVKRQVIAWPSREYINGLSERTRATTQREFDRISAAGGMMAFIRDNKRRVLQSQVFMPDDRPGLKAK